MTKSVCNVMGTGGRGKRIYAPTTINEANRAVRTVFLIFIRGGYHILFCIVNLNLVDNQDRVYA